MKRSWLTGMVTGLGVCLVALAFGRTILAQGASPATGRVACVNVMRTLSEYQKYKDLMEEVNAHQQKLQAEESQRRNRIDALSAQIDAMDPEDPTLSARMQELLNMQIDYKNWTEFSRMGLGREIGVWTVRLYNDLRENVQKIAERDGYDLVFYKGEFEPASWDPEVLQDQIRSIQVLYSKSTVDLTSQVLDQLNTNYRAQPKAQMLKLP